jgi:hypothetical protein
MGIPYSREINAAFEQVTPLVQSAYEVLDTTKNIAVFLAYLQVLIAVTLILNLLAMIGLLFTLNPDLEKERKLLVTPVMKWIAGFSMTASGHRNSIASALVGFFILAGAGFWFYVYYVRTVEDPSIENEKADEPEREMKGKDVEAIKRGEAKQ